GSGRACRRGKLLGSRPGNGLGQVEHRWILALAKVRRAEELLQADNLGAAAGSLANAGEGLLQVALRLGFTPHLHQAECDRAGLLSGHGFPMVRSKQSLVMRIVTGEGT